MALCWLVNFDCRVTFDTLTAENTQGQQDKGMALTNFRTSEAESWARTNKPWRYWSIDTYNACKQLFITVTIFSLHETSSVKGLMGTDQAICCIILTVGINIMYWLTEPKDSFLNEACGDWKNCHNQIPYKKKSNNNNLQKKNSSMRS